MSAWPPVVPIVKCSAEFGLLGALVAFPLIVRAVFGDVFGLSDTVQIVISVVLVLGLRRFARSLGRPMFIFLLLIMFPLATTELGTDGWITSLMKPEMKQLGYNAAWVLVYTSAIMLVLRFFAGNFVHKLVAARITCDLRRVWLPSDWFVFRNRPA